jgi:hypothetical protein
VEAVVSVLTRRATGAKTAGSSASPTRTSLATTTLLTGRIGHGTSVGLRAQDQPAGGRRLTGHRLSRADAQTTWSAGAELSGSRDQASLGNVVASHAPAPADEKRVGIIASRQLWEQQGDTRRRRSISKALPGEHGRAAPCGAGRAQPALTPRTETLEAAIGVPRTDQPSDALLSCANHEIDGGGSIRSRLLHSDTWSDTPRSLIALAYFALSWPATSSGSLDKRFSSELSHKSAALTRRASGLVATRRMNAS